MGTSTTLRISRDLAPGSKCTLAAKHVASLDVDCTLPDTRRV